VLVVGAKNGNCPALGRQARNVSSCASCHTHVPCTKAKDADHLVHLEVANVGTPPVSIVVPRAVAKGLALVPIPRPLFAVVIGFDLMKDRSGKNS